MVVSHMKGDIRILYMMGWVKNMFNQMNSTYIHHILYIHVHLCYCQCLHEKLQQNMLKSEVFYFFIRSSWRHSLKC